MEFPLSLRLDTNRCILRAISELDDECAWSASRVAGFTDGMTWDPPENKDQIREVREATIQQWLNGTDFTFSICTKQPEVCIGRIVIRKTETDAVWDIGYWLHPDYQGQGYMSEAVEVIVKFGFTELHASAIESAHALWNKGSEKVLLKAGFSYVRNNPQGFLKHDVWVEEKEYLLKKEDWERENRTL